MGKTVVIEGVVVAISISLKGHILISLKDEADSIDIIFFADAAQKVREIYFWKAGERIRV
jgi:exonuclease VII large subunit